MQEEIEKKGKIIEIAEKGRIQEITDEESGPSVDKLFEEISDDLHKPKTTFDKFIDAFKQANISTFDDIKKIDRAKYKELKIPIGIENKLKEKIKILTSHTTPFVHKECLILWQSKYPELRKVEKCEGLGDLDQAEEDAKNARKIARRMGVDEGNIHTLTDATAESVDKHLEEIYNRCLQKIDSIEDEAYLFVYCAGHGIADQQQYFVVNDNNIKCLVKIEQRLRALACLVSGLKIVAVYDVCRQDKATVKHLQSINDSPLLDSDTGGAGEDYSYTHIGTQPLKLVDAQSILCRILLNELEKGAKKAQGIIEFPSLLLDIPAAEKRCNGGIYTLKFD